MLDCKLCNYFKSINSGKSAEHKCMCQLTGFVFHKETEEYDIEYPCYNFEFERKAPENEELTAAESDELKLA